MKVMCPTCGQSTALKYRPITKDYIMLTHFTHTHIICATTGTVYPQELAKIVFSQGNR